MQMQQKRACDRCHRLKQVCDKQHHCSRCVRAEVGCTYNRTPALLGRPRVSEDKPRRTINKSKYSHNACTNCKKRKQKCDEAWPKCLTCQRLNLNCSGPVKVLKIKTHKASTEVTPSTVEQLANIDHNDTANGNLETPNNFEDILEKFKSFNGSSSQSN